MAEDFNGYKNADCRNRAMNKAKCLFYATRTEAVGSRAAYEARKSFYNYAITHPLAHEYAAKYWGKGLSHIEGL